MIPKIIHVTWFGPKEFVWKYEKEVREMYSDDYEIKVWTGENLDFVEDNAFVKFAKEMKKWVFVNDYYRIKILEKYGGVYIDTDMLPTKKLDSSFHQRDFLMGYEFRNFITTGFCAAEPNSEFIKRMVDYYDSLVKPSFVPLSNLLATEVVYSMFNIGVANKTRDLKNSKFGNSLILNRRAFGLWNDSNWKTYFIHKHNSYWIESKIQRWLLETGALFSKLTPAFVTNIMSGHQRKMTNKRFKENLKGISYYSIENKNLLTKKDFNAIVNLDTYVNIELKNSNKFLIKTLKKIPNVKKVRIKGKIKFNPDKFEKVDYTISKSKFITYKNGLRSKIETDHNVMNKHFLNGHDELLMK